MTRLLTLTGSGGSGKTRLALEVARDCVGAYPDGVWLVELSGLSEGGLVAQKVAAALGVAEQPGRSITDTLVGTLRDRRLLLVLDNCEHLIGASARLVDALLDSCPRLRLLATSREPLELAGEVKRSVPPLSAPDPGRPPTVGELEGYESVRLFMERGRNKVVRLRADARERDGYRRGVPAAGGHTVGHRAGGRAGRGALGRADLREAQGPFEVLEGGQPDGDAEAADAPGHPGLELRAARRGPSGCYFEGFRFSQAASRSKRPRR